MSAEAPVDPFRLEPRTVRRAFDRAAGTYEGVAVLQARVRKELLARLDLVKLEPQVVLDLGSATGLGARALKRRFRRAVVVAVDFAPGMLRAARRNRGLLARFERVCADAVQLPLPAQSVDLVFSNLMLQWCDAPDAVFAEVRRVLKPGGFFSFSTLGPDTLRELRAAWAAADRFNHVSRFLDMHDLGDALGRAGLAEPVLDVERVTLTYPDAQDLLRELKAMGSANATAARPRGLTGRARLQRLRAAYEPFRQAQRLPATYEVVYGAAWGASGRPAVAAQGAEVRVPVGAIGRRRT